VRLADVGTGGTRGERQDRELVFDHDGGQRRAIMLAIQRQPRTEHRGGVDNIKQLLSCLSGADAASAR